MQLKYKNKKLLLIPVAILIIIAGSSAYALISQYTRSPASDNKDAASTATDSPTAKELEQQAKTDAENKKDYVDSQTKQDGVTQTPSNNNAISVSINPYRQSDNLVVVTTNLTSVSDGKCTLTVTNGANRDEQSAEVIYQPNYSVCAGFSIPVSSLGNGTWNISLKVTSKGNDYRAQESIVVE